MAADPEIWCPGCNYRPRPTDRWDCVPTCGTRWHTFWTRGMCPGCGVRWPKTQCPQCGEWPPHEDWYHYPDADDAALDDAQSLEDPVTTSIRDDSDTG